MSYVSTMMDAQAVVYRPNVHYDSRHGALPQYFPIDPYTGQPTSRSDGNAGPAANRLEPDPLPCSVQQASPRDIMLYGQRNAEFSTTLIFDRNPYCQMNDQIRVTDYTGTVSYYLATGAARPTGRGQQWVVTASFVEQPLFP